MAPVKQALSLADIESRLRKLPDWTYENDALVRHLSFPSYLEGLAYVDRLAHEADRMDHHPSLVLDYKKVTVSYSTHSAGGITDLDFEAAERAEKLFSDRH
jgi:4a-hydroxytetrahydrobiopterin dehydratase